ncbi:MAG TPA: sulfite exporter TauE/SafE family protein [Ktedonobacteraceae bacterium]|jgi:hypothetical protein
MVLLNILLLLGASVLGGTLNSVAGGGSFLTFPALIYVGIPPIQANATSTTGLWPGSASAAWALRRELARQSRSLLLVLGVSSVTGGIGGAILLLNTPQTAFTLLIPLLLLLATVLFAVSPLVNARLKQRTQVRQKGREMGENEGGPRWSWFALTGIAVLQLAISVYGGYFGGGIGVLMLASFGVMGMQEINEMNAIKNTLAASINGVAVITFVLARAVVWQDVLVMIVGALAGGYGGVYYARKLDPRAVRGFILLVGSVMTVYFFFKYIIL